MVVLGLAFLGIATVILVIMYKRKRRNRKYLYNVNSTHFREENMGHPESNRSPNIFTQNDSFGARPQLVLATSRSTEFHIETGQVETIENRLSSLILIENKSFHTERIAERSRVFVKTKFQNKLSTC